MAGRQAEELEKATARLAEKNDELARVAAESAQALADKAELEQMVEEALARQDELEGQLEVLRRAGEDLEAKLTEAFDEKLKEKEEVSRLALGALTGEVERLSVRAEESEKVAADVREALAGKNQEVDQALRVAAEAEAGLAKAGEELDALRTAQRVGNELAAQLARSEKEAEELSGRVESLSLELEQAGEDRKTTVQALQEKERRLEGELAELEASRSSVEAELRTAVEKLESAMARLEEAHREEATAMSRKQEELERELEQARLREESQRLEAERLLALQDVSEELARDREDKLELMRKEKDEVVRKVHERLDNLKSELVERGRERVKLTRDLEEARQALDTPLGKLQEAVQEKDLLARDLAAALEGHVRLESTLSAAMESLEMEKKKSGRLEGELETMSGARPELEQEMKEVEEALATREADFEARRVVLSGAIDRHAELLALLEARDLRIESLRSHLGEALAVREEASRRLALAFVEMAEVQQRLAEESVGAQTLRDQVRGLEGELGTLQREAGEKEELARVIDQLQGELADARTSIDGLSSLEKEVEEAEGLRGELEGLTKDRLDLEARLHETTHKLAQKEDLFRVFEEEMADLETSRDELTELRELTARTQKELDKNEGRTLHERRLFLELEENYKLTIMELNNEKEDALIRLSELEERAKRLDEALRETRQIATQLGEYATALSGTRRKMQEAIKLHLDG